MGSDTQGTAPSPPAEKACQATEIYCRRYIFFGLQVCHLASTPAADCSCAYLAPGYQLPLGFGGRPEVPEALHSTILLDRNSFLNYSTSRVGQPHTAPARGPHTHPRNSSSYGWPGLFYTQVNAVPSSRCFSHQETVLALRGKGSALVKSQETGDKF
jgi:hypothetical protein